MSTEMSDGGLLRGGSGSYDPTPPGTLEAFDDNFPEDQPMEDFEEEDEDIHVVDLDMELEAMPSRFPAGSAGGPGGAGGGTNVKGRGVFHRKDRVMFMGVPPGVPPLPEREIEWAPQRYLILSNLHWTMNEAALWDGGCAYGVPRGVHIFVSPLKKKSEGIALVEFTTVAAVQKAQEDQGRAWSVKQSSRQLHLSEVPQTVIEALSLLPTISEKDKHWSRATQISQALVDAVFQVVDKPPPPAFFIPTAECSIVAVKPDDSKPPLGGLGAAGGSPLLPQAISSLIGMLQPYTGGSAGSASAAPTGSNSPPSGGAPAPA